jgi:hypothetical protein
MTSPDALRGLQSYILHPHWAKDYEDVLRYIEQAVTGGNAVLVTRQTDQDVYRRSGWQTFEVMERGEKLILY